MQPIRPVDEFPFAPMKNRKNENFAPPSSTSSFTSSSSPEIPQNDLLGGATKNTSVDLLSSGADDFCFAPPKQSSQLATIDLANLYSQNAPTKISQNFDTGMSRFVSANGTKTGADPKRFGVRNLGDEDPFAGLL